MNLCIITSSFPSHPNDPPQAPFVIDFIEGLKRRNHQVFVFTQDRVGVKEDFLKGVKIKWFSWMKSKKPLVTLNPFNPSDMVHIGSLFFKGKKEILPFVRENRIDACLALWVLPAGYFANYVYRKIRIPYSVWALGSDIYRYGRNPFLHPLMKRIILDAKGCFADGFDLVRRIEESFGKKSHYLPTSRKIYIPSYLNNEGLKEEHPPYRFLFVGRLEKVKGIDLLLQAISLLKEENCNFHLTVVGRGRMEKWAKSFTEHIGIEDRVTFLGKVSDLELASLYHSVNCVVIPSRSESIPLVFSEALNFNQELIVTDVGDMGMLGRRYDVAEVVPPENPKALKEALKRKTLYPKDPQKEMKRKELLKLFDIENSVERFLGDYK